MSKEEPDFLNEGSWQAQLLQPLLHLLNLHIHVHLHLLPVPLQDAIGYPGMKNKLQQHNRLKHKF